MGPVPGVGPADRQPRPKSLTPQDNLRIFLRECEGVDEYTRFCCVLTAYAESDFESDAVQRNTVGVFQQDPRWWPSATQGTAAQCRAFLADFKANSKRHTGDPVRDCWMTQRWQVPNEGKTWPDPGPEFEAEKTRELSETWNYTRRVAAVAQIIKTGRLP